MPGLHITIIVLIEIVGILLGVVLWRCPNAVARWISEHGIRHERGAYLLAKALPVAILVLTILVVGAVY